MISWGCWTVIKTNYYTGLLKPEDFRRKKKFTEVEFNDIILPLIFPQTVPTDRVDIISAAVLGRSSSGKSKLLEWLAYTAKGIYGEYLNIIYANGYRVAETKINDLPVQLIILDDVSGQASSFKGGNADSIQVNNTFRHALEDAQKAAGNRYYGGQIIAIKSWQRDNDLHRAFKQDDIRIYKTVPALSDEKEELADEIGPHYIQKLEDITYRILVKKDQSAKSVCVAAITSIGKNGGVGVLRYELTDYRFPRILDEREYLKKIEREAKEAEKAEKESAKASSSTHAPVRARVSDEAVIALHNEGRSVREISKLLPISPTTVHRKLKAAGYAAGQDPHEMNTEMSTE